MSHKPATPNEGKLPEKIYFNTRECIDLHNRCDLMDWRKIRVALYPHVISMEVSTCYVPEALLREARAKAFEEAALIVDKRETNGATAHILLRKAIEAREGK